MSEYSVEVERMTVRLENLFVGSGSLSPNLFLRIYNGIEQFEGMKSMSLKQDNEWELQANYALIETSKGAA